MSRKSLKDPSIVKHGFSFVPDQGRTQTSSRQYRSEESTESESKEKVVLSRLSLDSLTLRKRRHKDSVVKSALMGPVRDKSMPLHQGPVCVGRQRVLFSTMERELRCPPSPIRQLHSFGSSNSICGAGQLARSLEASGGCHH